MLYGDTLAGHSRHSNRRPQLALENGQLALEDGPAGDSKVGPTITEIPSETKPWLEEALEARCQFQYACSKI